MEPDQPLHVRPTVFVIVQQHSSFIIASLPFHSRKKSSSRYENVTSFFTLI
jgi:hypothetical protein